ncbi:TPA: hypothetical protein PXE99_001071, partial [Mannheimia haemolytica]|nr:hypothetical protein [Mannheimia haemolytica]
MEKHNIFKLSAISVALLGIASQGYAIDCYNKTIMEGFLSQDSSFLSNKCTYDLTGETNIDPEIELKNSNAEFNDTTILVSGDKKSKRYSLGFHHYLGLLPLSDNSNVVFNNSNISILSYSTGRP